MRAEYKVPVREPACRSKRLAPVRLQPRIAFWVGLGLVSVGLVSFVVMITIYAFKIE